MFKTYSRKSSAMIGADRAGISRDNVYAVDGVWGFDVVLPAPVVENVVVEEPVVPKVAPSRHRRQTLRNCYRALKEIAKHNRAEPQKISPAWMLLAVRSHRTSAARLVA